MIKLTEQALEHFRGRVQAGELVAISIKRYGCSGYAYECAITNHIPEGFSTVDAHGLTVAYDAAKERFFQGLVVDYRRQGLNSKVIYVNPNETARCGCGESVQFSQD